MSPLPPLPAVSLHAAAAENGAGGDWGEEGGRRGDGGERGHISPHLTPQKERRDRKVALRILPPQLDVSGAGVGGEGSESSSAGYDDEMRMHGLPLRLFHSRCHMEPYLPMELLVTPSPLPQRYACAAASSSSAAARVASSGGVLAGSSNRMFIVGGPMSGIDAVANAETGQVQIRCEVLRKAAILSVHERQVADELLNTVEEHFRLKQRMREMREEAAVSSHLAAAAEAASVVAQGGGGFSAVVRVQSLDAPIPAESNLNEDEGVASRVRSQLALYTFRLLQAAARQACTTNWSPDSLKRELAEHEMPRIHGAAWTAAWQATSNFDRCACVCVCVCFVCA